MASNLIYGFDNRSLNGVIGQRAVAATLVDVVALLGRRAHAATVAAEGGAAALRLALVVLEDEEAVITGLELGAGEGLIRRRRAPSGGIAGLQADSVKSTHYLIGVARAAAVRQRIRGEALLHVLEGRGGSGLLLDLVLETLNEIHVLEAAHAISAVITATTAAIATVATLALILLEALQVCHAEGGHIHH